MAVTDPKPVETKTVTVKYTEWGEYHYFASFCLSFGYREDWKLTGDIKVTRIWADGILIYARAGGGAQTYNPGLKFTVRPGTADQMPIGGTELAYRDQLLIWFHDMDLDTSGAIPAITAEWTDDVGATLIDALSAFASRAGYEDDDIVVDPELDYPIVGYVADGQATLNTINTNLGFIYNFTGVEVAGQIVFKQNYDADGNVIVQWTIPEHKIAVISETSSDQQIDVIELAADQGLPRSIAITYYDVDFNFDQNTQTAARNLGTSASETDVNVTLPIVGQAQEMKAFATDALYRVWDQKNGHSLRFPREYIGMDPGDVVHWTVGGEVYVGEAQRVTINADWSVSVSAAEVAVSFTAITSLEYQPPATPVSTITPEPVNAVVFDIPDWQADQVQPGLLNLRVAMGGYEPGKFTGARFDMTRVDQPTGWAPRVQLTASQEIGIGALTAKPTNYSGEPGGLDTTSVLTVDLRNMPLARIIAGVDTLLAVGKDGRFELLSYADYEDLGGGLVVLTNLTRGLFGTEDSVNQHDITDNVSFTADLKTITYSVDDYVNSRTFFFRGIPPLLPTQDATVKYFKPLGNSRRPYSPNNIQAVRAIEGDIVFTWEKQDRFAGEPDSIWSVEIYSPDWLTLLQRINNVIIGDVTADNVAFTYYLDYQFTNGINELTTINALVYQMNADHGVRGFPGGGGIVARQQGILSATSKLELFSDADIGADIFLAANSTLLLFADRAVLTGGREVLLLKSSPGLLELLSDADLLIGGLEANSTLTLTSSASLTIVGDSPILRGEEQGALETVGPLTRLKINVPSGTEVGDLLVFQAKATPNSLPLSAWNAVALDDIHRISGVGTAVWSYLNRAKFSTGPNGHYVQAWKIVEEDDLSGFYWLALHDDDYDGGFSGGSFHIMRGGNLLRFVNFRPDNPISGSGSNFSSSKTSSHTAPSVAGKNKGLLYNTIMPFGFLIPQTPGVNGYQKPSDMTFLSGVSYTAMTVAWKALTVDGATGSKTYTPPVTAAGA